MFQTDKIIDQLGIKEWDDEKRSAALEEAVFRIGQAVTDDLTDQQFEEYEAIVNDNHDVIDAWLDTHVPDYKDSPIYQTYVEEYNDDPEKNNPAKLFSSVAWIQENVPDFEARANRAVEEYRQELESHDANQPQ